MTKKIMWVSRHPLSLAQKTAIDDLVKLADEIHSGKEIREYITAHMRNLQAYAEGWEAE